MIDLPSASPSPTPAPAARPSTGSPQRDTTTQSDESPFQEALTRELGLACAGRTPPENPARAAGAAARPGLKTDGEEATAAILPFLPESAAAAAADAKASPVPAATIPLFPAATDAATDPLAAQAPEATIALLAESADAPTDPLVLPEPNAAVPFLHAPVAALATAPRPGRAPSGGQSGSPLPASGSGSARLALGPRTGATAPNFAATNAADDVSAAAPADMPVHGKVVPSAGGETKRAPDFGAGLIELHQAASPGALSHAGGSAAPAPAQASVATLAVPVGDRGWGQALGDKLVWMVTQHHQAVELHLNPPDLGPLKITLTLNDDQASARFVSSHAAVREAIETAMPRLREMLADSGITLGNASVSTDAFREQAHPQQEPRAYPTPNTAAAAEPGTLMRGERTIRRSEGMIDTFA